MRSRCSLLPRKFPISISRLDNGKWTKTTIRYRAPVLLGYAGNKVGDSAFGAEYSEEYTNTLWNVSAPFNDEVSLGHWAI
jgi:hypothetical protein